MGFDNGNAGRTAARYLLDLGHSRFGMIAGITQDNDRAAGRRNGLLNELERSGIDRARLPVVEGAYRLGDRRRRMQRLMEDDGRPTASRYQKTESSIPLCP